MKKLVRLWKRPTFDGQSTRTIWFIMTRMAGENKRHSAMRTNEEQKSSVHNSPENYESTFTRSVWTVVFKLAAVSGDPPGRRLLWFSSPRRREANPFPAWRTGLSADDVAWRKVNPGKSRKLWAQLTGKRENIWLSIPLKAFIYKDLQECNVFLKIMVDTPHYSLKL